MLHCSACGNCDNIDLVVVRFLFDIQAQLNKRVSNTLSVYSTVSKDNGGDVKRVELNLLSLSLDLQPVAATSWWEEAAVRVIFSFLFPTTQKSSSSSICVPAQLSVITTVFIFFVSQQKHCLIVCSRL